MPTSLEDEEEDYHQGGIIPTLPAPPQYPPDGFFLLLDRIDCTLADKIQEWKLEEKISASKTTNKHSPQKTRKVLETKLRYARELASALEYLHDHQLIYLKPDKYWYFE